MNAADVIGYVVDECSLICADCLEEGESDESAVFADSETDCPNHCERCGELLPQSLTTDGQEYVREAVWSGEGDPDVLAQWASEFDYAFPRCANCGEDLDEVGKKPLQVDNGGKVVYYCDETCKGEAEEEA